MRDKKLGSTRIWEQIIKMGNLCCCFSKKLSDKFSTIEEDSETVVIPHENTAFTLSDEASTNPSNDPIFTIENEIRRHSSKRSNKSERENRRISNDPSQKILTNIQNDTVRESTSSNISAYIIPNQSTAGIGTTDQIDGFQRPSKSRINEVNKNTDTLKVKYAASRLKSVPGSKNLDKKTSDKQNDSHREYQLLIEEFDRYMDKLRVSYASSKRVPPKEISDIFDGLQEQSKSSTNNVKIVKDTKTQPNREPKRPEIRSTHTTNAEFLHQKSQMILNNFRDVITSQNFAIPKAIRNNNILEQLFRFCSSESFTQMIENQNMYKLEILNERSKKFQTVKRMFFSTNKKYFKVHCIEMVHNPYLLMLYELKKLEYSARGSSFEEKLLFHGTKKSNIEAICRENFNWRLRGASRGYTFGQGISFSPIAYYSTHYGDQGYNKVMVLAKVIVGNCCVGAPNMKIPPYGYDTSIKENGHVYVKYDDNTYYPLYLIHYGGHS